MSDMRIRYTAEYLYPGMLFPEETSRSVPEPTFAAAVAASPHEDGYFKKDGWYAVHIHATTEKHFTADDGEEVWVKQETKRVGSWVIGERIHYSDISEDSAILISNIRVNSTDGYGVKTRAGNWQIASDYTEVVAPEQVSA